MVVAMKNYIKSKSFFKLAGLTILVFAILLITGTTTSSGQDNKTAKEAPLGGTEKKGFPKLGQILSNDEWTSQMIYDTLGACYQGTIRWIVMTNPSLIGQAPNVMAQRQMMEHCFCVLDKIRYQIPLKEYMVKVYDQQYVGNLFMVKAVECVAEYQTLPSFFTRNIIPDNETKKVEETPKIESPKVEDLPESLPDQLEENPTGGPTTIFQG